jgi:hypothetical protein
LGAPEKANGVLATTCFAIFGAGLLLGLIPETRLDASDVVLRYFGVGVAVLGFFVFPALVSREYAEWKARPGTRAKTAGWTAAAWGVLGTAGFLVLLGLGGAGALAVKGEPLWDSDAAAPKDGNNFDELDPVSAEAVEEKPEPEPVPQGTRSELLALCEAGNSKGCLELGIKWGNGDGGERDLGEARRWVDRACQLGDRDACQFLGEIKE